jgi:cytochrome c
MAKMIIKAASALAFLAIAAQNANSQDATAGAKLFQQRCMACHTTKAGQRAIAGPNLAGVTGRPAASTTFSYSSAFKKSGLTLDGATMDSYLAAPSRLVPGTRMSTSVPDAKQRADIIAYLATLKP